MTTISVTYQRRPDAQFNHDYFAKVHLPLVKRLWGDYGMTGIEALLGNPDAPFLAVALLTFSSEEAFNAAMKGEAAAEVLGDIPNYTNLQPVLQVNKHVAA